MFRIPASAFALLAAAGLSVSSGLAQEAPSPPGEWLHASSLIGKPRYAAGFAHFDYVNPNAPKGGAARLSGSGETFDTLNPILDKGVTADGLGLIYESLMTPAMDEYDTSA